MKRNGWSHGPEFTPITVCRFAMGVIFTTELYAEHKTPLIANMLLQAALLSVVVVSVIVCLVVVSWLGGSFGFFCVGLCIEKKYKCATKCVGV